MVVGIIVALVFILVLLMSIGGRKQLQKLEKEDPSISKYLGDKF